MSGEALSYGGLGMFLALEALFESRGLQEQRRSRAARDRAVTVAALARDSCHVTRTEPFTSCSSILFSNKWHFPGAPVLTPKVTPQLAPVCVYGYTFPPGPCLVWARAAHELRASPPGSE